MAPSVNVTVPTGAPALEVVVEVNITDWPTVEGFGELSSVVLVVELAAFTTWGAPASLPLLPSHPEFPVKVAVMVWLPTESVVVLKEAWPVPSTVTFEARTVEPSANVTVPAGTPLPVTVAVNVTD